ncbi:unnamed protein product [Arabidopsis lyrata]|nr:unnamed protein product [Arabidopsis lyrata]
MVLNLMMMMQFYFLFTCIKVLVPYSLASSSKFFFVEPWNPITSALQISRSAASFVPVVA